LQRLLSAHATVLGWFEYEQTPNRHDACWHTALDTGHVVVRHLLMQRPALSHVSPSPQSVSIGWLVSEHTPFTHERVWHISWPVKGVVAAQLMRKHAGMHAPLPSQRPASLESGSAHEVPRAWFTNLHSPPAHAGLARALHTGTGDVAQLIVVHLSIHTPAPLQIWPAALPHWAPKGAFTNWQTPSVVSQPAEILHWFVLVHVLPAQRLTHGPSAWHSPLALPHGA
jgi:hypothetical protein